MHYNKKHQCILIDVLEKTKLHCKTTKHLSHYDTTITLGSPVPTYECQKLALAKNCSTADDLLNHIEFNSDKVVVHQNNNGPSEG